MTRYILTFAALLLCGFSFSLKFWEKNQDDEDNVKIEIIAPSSGYIPAEKLALVRDKLDEHGFNFYMRKDLIKDKIFFANTYDFQLKHLSAAIADPTTDIIWPIRGGYGSSRLINALRKLPKPEKEKLYIGYSDSTALMLFFNQAWGWKTIHGAMALDLTKDHHDSRNIEILKKLMRGEQTSLEYSNLKPLNKLAKNSRHAKLAGEVSGGNLMLLQNSIGTSWELDAKDKIIVIEEINEKGYRVDRMLDHLLQANILNNAKAIVLGDFIDDAKFDQNPSHLDYALQRFADSAPCPVFKTDIFGHGAKNLPFVIGSNGTIQNDGGKITFRMDFDFAIHQTEQEEDFD